MGWLNWLLAMSAGLIAGSFINVVIYRGPVSWGLVGEDRQARGSLFGPRSQCPSCRELIESWRLIPVISYLAQGGKCAKCAWRIPLRYPFVEIAGAAIAIASLLVFGASMPAALFAVYGWFLLALAAVDWETGFLPDRLTLPLIAIGLAANYAVAFTPLADALIGAGVGYAAFRLIGVTFQKLRGIEGLGQGDAKLLAAIGAWGGWVILPATVFVAAVLTLLFVVLAALQGKKTKRDTPIAFGPGLCVAGFGLLASRDLLVSVL